MSSEYFMITSLYLVRLKIFQWIKFLQRDQGSIKKKEEGNAEMNLKSTTTNVFNF